MRTLQNIACLGALVAALAGCGKTEQPQPVQNRSNTPAEVFEYKPLKGVKVQNDFGYKHDDIWYNRTRALEQYARQETPSNGVKTLETIAQKDEDWRIRKLANEMIESYKQRGDFAWTEPYREMRAEQRRLGIKTESDFGYKPSNIWYARMDAMERLQKNATRDSITAEILSDMEKISRDDDDHRIRQLTREMLVNYEKNGTFKDVPKREY